MELQQREFSLLSFLQLDSGNPLSICLYKILSRVLPTQEAFSEAAAARRPWLHFSNPGELVSLRPAFSTAQACRGERSQTWRWPPVSYLCPCFPGRCPARSPDSGLSVAPRWGWRWLKFAACAAVAWAQARLRSLATLGPGQALRCVPGAPEDPFSAG